MLVAILKAILIGICASAPLGPTAILILQKSLSYGHKPGFVTGLGATTVDTFWATVSIFAIALAENLIDRYQTYIYLIGGIILATIGIFMILKNPFKKFKRDNKEEIHIKYYLQALATAITNPAAVFVMIGLFAFFNLQTPDRTILILPLIVGVALGSCLYWWNFTWIFSHLGRKLHLKTLKRLNRVSGLIICLLGIYAISKGIAP